MERAVQKVRERSLRVTGALEQAGVPYALVGESAVAAWVSTVDEAAVRNTRRVDVLIRRDDLSTVKQALEAEGFVYRHAAGIDLFLDHAEAFARDAVHVLFAGELVHPHEALPNPDLSKARHTGEFAILDLEALVGIKLTAFRDKDRTHLRDMLEVGLIDASWCAHFPEALSQRLQSLIDDPEG
jgi:hypothetical protein